jgi:PKHD-type hydroxylase
MIKFNKVVSANPTNWYWFDEGFSNDEIARIERMSTAFNLGKAQISDDELINEDIRKSETGWIPFTDEYRWIYEKLAGMIQEANDVLWHFDLGEMEEMIQYTIYYEDGGHYDYHLDVGPGYPLNQRKISITVQLTGPDDYEGGDFEILRGGSPESLPKKKGCVLVFPSYILHRVKPVTKGTRKSLVLWVGGGSYK